MDTARALVQSLENQAEEQNLEIVDVAQIKGRGGEVEV